MELVGQIITYILMICCAIGGISYIINDQSELGQSFIEGLHGMANMFIPICGMMASLPFLSQFATNILSPIFNAIGADPLMGMAFFMSPDGGLCALAYEVAQTLDLLPTITITGFLCSATIVVNVPLGMLMLKHDDHKYLALGIMSGFLAIPFSVLVTSLIVMFSHLPIRSAFTSVGEPDHVIQLTMGVLIPNMIPLIVICILLVLGLRFFPRGMVKGFMIFGKIISTAMTLVVVASIIQHYTGLFTDVLHIGWGFDPLLGDETNPFRGVELCGTIGMMLSGALPMVTLIRKYLRKPLEKLGRLLGLDANGSVGLVACLPNSLAMFPLVGDMRPEDKVICIAFMVCGGYCLGDYLAFCVNFQPTLVVPILVGQVAGGIISIIFAKFIAVPKAKRMAAETSIES